MTVPNYPDKYDADACLTPDEHVDSGPDPAPDAVILTYQDDFFERTVAQHGCEPVEYGGPFPLQALDGTDGCVGLLGGFGIGGPSTAIAMESLAAAGVGAFCILGGCGALGHALDSGEALLVDRAVRDEGASHHYLPPATYVDADGGLVATFEAALDATDLPYRVGPTWSTDAIYRETYPEIDYYADRGVLAVEMEAATALAVARFRGADATALLAVHDRVTSDGWIPPDGWGKPRLDALLEPAREALLSHVA